MNKSKKATPKKQRPLKLKREPNEQWTEPVDKSIYDRTHSPYAVIKEAFIMRWDEFKLLGPRRIGRYFIAWENQGSGDGQNLLKSHCCEIFITDGFTEVEGLKHPIAYSFYVRWEDRTWKVNDLDACLKIVESMRILFVNEVAKHGTGKSKKDSYLRSPICWAIK